MLEQKVLHFCLFGNFKELKILVLCMFLVMEGVLVEHCVR